MTTRELPIDEWEKLAQTPLNAVHMQLRPEFSRVLVVEDGTSIVGVVVLLQALHVEGLWIAPPYRQRVSVLRRLLVTMRCWISTIADGALAGSDSVDMDRLLDTLGARRVPATLWYWPMSKKETSCLL